MQPGDRVLAFDKFGLEIDKRHGHPVDEGAYWRRASIMKINHDKETATIKWIDGTTSYNKPLNEMKPA